MRYDPSTIPQNDEEADERLVYVAKCYVVEKEMPTKFASRVIKEGLRNKANLEVMLAKFNQLVVESQHSTV
jgi:hypothetical protein